MPRYVDAMVDVALTEIESWRLAARENRPIDVAEVTGALAQNTIAAALFQSEVREQSAEVEYLLPTFLPTQQAFSFYFGHRFHRLPLRPGSPIALTEFSGFSYCGQRRIALT